MSAANSRTLPAAAAESEADAAWSIASQSDQPMSAAWRREALERRVADAPPRTR